MPANSSIDFFLNWAKERIDEMDATLASLESKVDEISSGSRSTAKQLIADLRQKRDTFEKAMDAQMEAGEAALAGVKTRLENEWAGFENAVSKYIDNFGNQIQQQQATFHRQLEAQLKAWRETADKLGAAANAFAGANRSALDATVMRMNADASAAEEKLKKLAQAGNESWSALNTALSQTRAAFDRANEAALEAFRRAQ